MSSQPRVGDRVEIGGRGRYTGQRGTVTVVHKGVTSCRVALDTRPGRPELAFSQLELNIIATPTWLTRLDDTDVATILHEWAGNCVPCVASLPGPCTCPTDEPAPIIRALAAEVLRLRAAAAAAV